ncbi:MAG: argininosuccinate lyase [Clostridia bacterium]|nr:argininosuccinate lyase [Clostridia bacterium]
MSEKKMWGGRFSQDLDSTAQRFEASIGFDQRLAREDIEGSIAHANMLGRQGIIPAGDAEKIVAGLRSILADIEAGSVSFEVGDEDIHMNVERLLTERIGEAGKRLHTGRSRNDQVATDMRLYAKKAASDIIGRLKDLCGTLIRLAEDNEQTIMSAYTHLQKAQPTTLAHYLMAYFEMFYRDIGRFEDSRRRTDVLPLGSGALCATTYPLDREVVAGELGFAQISRNSLDAVSDRDFVLEFLAAAAICMMHLSRLCEELVLYSSNEFGLISLSDAYSTGSSIMPQKKNPDMAELIRGKTGRVYGDLMGMLTVMKGLPLAYNKDLQEDKEGFFDAADTLADSLLIVRGMLETAEFRKDRMKEEAGRGFTNATDAADYLVRHDVPFRDAHEIIGRLVLACEQQGRAIGDLSLAELQEFSPHFGSDIHEAIALETCVSARSIAGGPAPAAVARHIQRARELLGSIKE